MKDIDEIKLDEDDSSSDDQMLDLITNGVFPEGPSTKTISQRRQSTKTLSPCGTQSL